MKMNVLRALVVPWLIFFFFALTALIVAGVHFQVPTENYRLLLPILGGVSLICVIANIGTLRKAGIWIAYSLPLSLRYTSMWWILRALIAVGIALLFWWIGQLPWMPLVWAGIVIPVVFSMALFIAIWSLVGPILKMAAKVPLGRVFAFFVSLPVFATVPVMALFLGHMVTVAYLASRPEIHLGQTAAIEKEEETKTETKTEELPTDKRALALREIALAGKSCPDATKEVQSALALGSSEDVAYWAVKATKCTDMKSVVGLPRLVDLMMKHPSAKVRAAATRMMMKWGQENVKPLIYLLVKRITDKEDPEVIQAAAWVLVHLGEEGTKSATSRLKNLLDSHRSHAAAKVLISEVKRDDLVAEYVAAHLTDKGEARNRAVGMICLLPESARHIDESQVPSVVASVKTGDPEDPAMMALECLGDTGFQAMRQEMKESKNLNRVIAARALAGMRLRKSPEAIETVETCSRDHDPEVRKWCSQSLGRIGGPALPKILELIESGDGDLRESGRNALNHFDDIEAKEELQKVRAENSGWFANRKNLKTAEAVSTALIRIEVDERRAKAKAAAEAESRSEESKSENEKSVQ